ncbi:MAG: HlyD family efflux transporter periplasmic adaptor subunit [Rhodopirellula sp.]|nr:HlyD family efflux transporter periplasmic adaptor subunit [Rhodopirellula sp.]
MLVPVAYSESVMPALSLARSSRLARRIAKLLSAGLVVTIALMAFAPWQQSINGSGSVLAYSPDDRQQVLQAPIKGRIVRWGEGVFENARVREGQLLAEIRDLDEAYASRLQRQLSNTDQTVAAAREQLAANERALDAARRVVESCEAQVRAYQTVKQETAAAQEAYVEMAEEKVRAEEQQLAEYQAAPPQLQAEYDRLKILQSEGNVALQKFQEVDRKLAEARAKVMRAEAYLAAAQSELEGKQREQTAKVEKAQVDIDYAQAALRKATGDVSKAESDVAKSRQELNKAEKELLDMQVKVARQENQRLTAPFDGFLVQINPNLGSAILKEGDPICTIVPDTTDRSVQIWLDGNDAPLVESGRPVRLQFEGWPAVQFAGWPSVAVGTFGGKVVSVDAIDNGKGQFRALVCPDPAEESWPEGRFLRQGVRANGWILLNRVPLWYEVWRKLNGFPPVVSMEKPASKDDAKVPKLPK